MDGDPGRNEDIALLRAFDTSPEPVHRAFTNSAQQPPVPVPAPLTTGHRRPQLNYLTGNRG